MPENKLYPPEGLRPPSSFTLQSLREAMEQNTVLEDRVLRCDAGQDVYKRQGVDKDWPARFLLPLMAHNPSCKYVLASDCVDDALSLIHI